MTSEYDELLARLNQGGASPREQREAAAAIRALAAQVVERDAVIGQASQALATEIIPFGDSMWRTWDKKILATRAALSQAPRDALAAHDKTVREAARREAADLIVDECDNGKHVRAYVELTAHEHGTGCPMIPIPGVAGFGPCMCSRAFQSGSDSSKGKPR